MYFITTFRSWSTKLLCYRAFGALGIYVAAMVGAITIWVVIRLSKLLIESSMLRP